MEKTNKIKECNKCRHIRSVPTEMYKWKCPKCDNWNDEGVKTNEEEIIDEDFSGILEYRCSSRRHEDEMETFYLNKGDKVIIIRKQNG